MSVPDWMIDAPQVSVDDLAALVRRLARALRKAAPDNDLPDQAVDYLRRHHLVGSILRDPALAAQTETQPASECEWLHEDDDSGTWATGCGNLFQFTDGGPGENDFRHCCYCGGALTPAQPAPAPGAGKGEL